MNWLVRSLWNRREARPRALVRLAIQIALLLAVFTFLQLLVVQPTVSLLGGFPMRTDRWVPLSAITVLLGMVASLWVAARAVDRRPMADYGLHFGRTWWLDLGFGLTLGALLMTGIFAFELAVEWVVVLDTLRTPGPDGSFVVAILAAGVLFLCVGVYEELLLRGYQLLNLAEGLSCAAIGSRRAIVLAWLFSSSMFGALHLGNPNATAMSTLSLVLAGLFLGLGYVLTGELAISIGLHIAWNFFQGNVFSFPVSGTEANVVSFIVVEQSGPELWTGGAFGPEAGLIGIVALVLGSLLILAWVRLRYGRVALYTPLAEYRSPEKFCPSVPA